MALYDNKYWLLSHIRNSFISTDDTGMCELIMSGEESLRKKMKQTDPYPDPEESDDDFDDDVSCESYDLQMDADFGMRYRSNTAAQLEKLEQAKKRTARIRHVKWETTTPNEEESEDMFQRKELPKSIEPKVSLMTLTLKENAKLPSNPYVEYAKFDGNGQISLQVKKYKIFMTMLPENVRNYPLHVCCIATAKIQELIGLILLKCSTTHAEHTWRPVSHYNLYITEEDGEVDRDFPRLEPRENIAKFGFTCLGLVESQEEHRSVNFDSSAEPIQLRRSNNTSMSGNTSNNNTLLSVQANEEASDRRSKEQQKMEQQKQISADLHLMDSHNRAMEAPLYRSYIVNMVNRVRGKQEIHLGVSGDKIEIDSIHPATRLSLGKTKPINHEVDSIAGCEIGQIRGQRATFKISVVGSAHSNDPKSFKSYEMETDAKTAQEIVDKIDLILKLRSSDIRKEYLAAQERKRYKSN